MSLVEMMDEYKQLRQLMFPYRCGIRIIKEKLESIDDELKCGNGHSPIHIIQSRIKSPSSILEKLDRKNLTKDIRGLQQLNDIAGLRVVCHYINDIQYIAQLLVLHEDITLIKKTNYIDYPKENGYRSLHLVVKVPVRMQVKTIEVPVEIQLRTIAMDCWASLEHELQYKNSHHVNEDICQRLKKCADQISQTDLEMQKIYQEVSQG